MMQTKAAKLIQALLIRSVTQRDIGAALDRAQSSFLRNKSMQMLPWTMSHQEFVQEMSLTRQARMYGCSRRPKTQCFLFWLNLFTLFLS